MIVNEVINRWTDPEEIRLRTGEIDPETMRTVLAVVNGFAREIKKAHNNEMHEETQRAYKEGRSDEERYG